MTAIKIQLIIETCFWSTTVWVCTYYDAAVTVSIETLTEEVTRALPEASTIKPGRNPIDKAI